MGLYSGGLVIGGIFTSEIWGAIFGRAYFFLVGGGRAFYRNFTVCSEWDIFEKYK